MAPLVVVTNPAIVVEAVKLAEDRSGDVIVRLYESLGARARGGLAPGFDWSEVTETDLLERKTDPRAVIGRSDRTISLSLRPFQLVTLRLRRTTRENLE